MRKELEKKKKEEMDNKMDLLLLKKEQEIERIFRKKKELENIQKQKEELFHSKRRVNMAINIISEEKEYKDTTSKKWLERA